MDKYQGPGVEIQPDITCRILNEGDLPQIDELLANNYSYQHPMREVFRVTPDDVGDMDVIKARDNLKSGTCLGAFVKGSQELVAVEMNTIHDDNETNFYKTTPKISEKSLAVFRFIKHVLGDVFDDLNTEKYMLRGMGCVRRDYRGRGILSSFNKVADEIAGLKGCEYALGVATSNYTQRSVKHSDYKVLREVFLDEYIDVETGKKPELDISPIHTSAQLVYKKVGKEKEPGGLQSNL